MSLFTLLTIIPLGENKIQTRIFLKIKKYPARQKTDRAFSNHSQKIFLMQFLYHFGLLINTYCECQVVDTARI